MGGEDTRMSKKDKVSDGRLEDPGELLADLRCEVQELFRVHREPGFRGEMSPLADCDFWFFERGRALVTVEGSPTRVEASAREVLLLFRPGEQIGTHILGPLRSLLYYFHFQPRDPYLWNLLSCPRQLLLPRGTLAPLFRRAWAGQAAALASGRTPRLARELLLRGLWEALSRRGLLVRRARPSDPRLVALERMDRHIAATLDQPLNLARLAVAGGVLPRTAVRLFRAYLRTTPMRYRADRRMERAQQQLVAGEPVAGVAEQLAYPDAFTFSKAFKRRFGLAPLHWLSRRREAEQG